MKNSGDAVRITRNDWSVLEPPPVGGWTPTETVSVVVPAYNCQEKLDLALAALSRQTYPAELIEVIVVDDGSDQPVELPKIRPGNCRIVRVADHSDGWGCGNALRVGVGNSTGAIVQLVDADIVVVPEHVEAHARWHHVAPDVVTLGHRRFAADGWTSPEEIAARGDAGTLADLFPDAETVADDRAARIIDDSDALRAGDHNAFLAQVGATIALRRETYDGAGGHDARLRFGHDAEFGYRLAQYGAVFVPEPAARAWHLGPSALALHGDRLCRYNQPHLADLMPYPRHLRDGATHRSWAVPTVLAVVVAAGPLELVTDCVDRLLASDLFDLRVQLVGAWPADERSRPTLDDPDLDLRLIAATYRSEPRVTLVATAPRTAFPAAHLLVVPSHVGVGRSTVRQLVDQADRERVGLVRIRPAGDTGGAAAVLWRTSARSRAARVRRPGERLADVVTAGHGARELAGAEFGVVDLRLPPPPPPPPRAPTRVAPARPKAQNAIAVTGLRSLGRAAVFVAVRYGWRGVRLLGRGLRRLVRPPQAGDRPIGGHRRR